MNLRPKSLRTFIGASDFDQSRAFYRDFGFEELIVSESMSLLKLGDVSFYLQRYYVEQWVHNSMLFLEVDDLDAAFADVEKLGLPDKYPSVRLQPIREEPWGREFFLHDPSGVLWHIGQFNR